MVYGSQKHKKHASYLSVRSEERKHQHLSLVFSYWLMNRCIPPSQPAVSPQHVKITQTEETWDHLSSTGPAATLSLRNFGAAQINDVVKTIEEQMPDDARYNIQKYLQVVHEQGVPLHESTNQGHERSSTVWSRSQETVPTLPPPHFQVSSAGVPWRVSGIPPLHDPMNPEY